MVSLLYTDDRTAAGRCRSRFDCTYLQVHFALHFSQNNSMVVKCSIRIEFFLIRLLLIWGIISYFPVGYREISVKIFFDLTLVPPVKIPIFMFLLLTLIARASQPDGNMTSFNLHFSRLT